MIEPCAQPPLPEHFRQSLGLDCGVPSVEALALAEARLKEVLEKQQKLPDKHPSQPKFKRDRQKLEPLIGELRELVFGMKVDELCDAAEVALTEKPPRRAIARDCLKHARIEANDLADAGIYLQRIQKIEGRVEKEPEVVAPVAEKSVPLSAPIPPLVAMPQPEPNPFLNLENLVDKGMACLAQDKPDEATAGVYFADAQKEATGKVVPENLRNRMQLFKRTLDQVRREDALAQIDNALNQASGVLGQDEAGIVEARGQLEIAAVLLKQWPDPYLQREVQSVSRAIEEHERWLKRRKTELATVAHVEDPFVETYPTEQPPVTERTSAHRKDDSVAIPLVLPPLVSTSRGTHVLSPSNPVIHVAAAPPPVAPRLAPVAVPPPPEEPAEQSVAVPAAPKRTQAMQWVALLLLFGLMGAAYAGYMIVKASIAAHAGNLRTNQFARTPEKNVVIPQPEIGQLSINVAPKTAELFTNGVSLGHPDFPLVVRGVSGKAMIVEASLPGYSNAVKTVTFPALGTTESVDLDLGPKPALLVVHSEPVATEVIVRKAGAEPVTVARVDDGIELAPSVATEVSIQVPDYQPVSRQLPALGPGERKVIDFGALKLQPAVLHLKVQPTDAQFTVIYEGRSPIPYGATASIEDIVPKTSFAVIASRQGYASESNSFTLKPREVAEYDFGKLKPLPATLMVNASPQPVAVKVAWDGAAQDYGQAGRIAGLPLGKNLVITVSATGREPATTNIVLEPGETRDLNFGELPTLKGFLLIKSDPPGAEVIYSLDGHAAVFVGVTDHIDGLPMGHTVEVTLHKAGYVNRQATRKLVLVGETVDFGQLTPQQVALTIGGPNDGADVYLDNHPTGVRSSGTLTNLIAGKTYNIRLHKSGRQDVNRTVTANLIGTNQSEQFPEMPLVVVAAPPPVVAPAATPVAVSLPAVEELIREINAHSVEVGRKLPLTDNSRRGWLDWITKVENMYRAQPTIWNRIQAPLDHLKSVVNTPTQRVPVVTSQ